MMNLHLLAWRKARNLSQQTVGAALGVAHTTIGRWENGDVPITVQDLERLAELYAATPRQLEHPPEMASLVAFMERAQHIVADLPPDSLEKWLSLGEALRPRK